MDLVDLLKGKKVYDRVTGKTFVMYDFYGNGVGQTMAKVTYDDGHQDDINLANYINNLELISDSVEVSGSR